MTAGQARGWSRRGRAATAVAATALAVTTTAQPIARATELPPLVLSVHLDAGLTVPTCLVEPLTAAIGRTATSVAASVTAAQAAAAALQTNATEFSSQLVESRSCATRPAC